MQNGEATYPEPLAKAIKAEEEAIADATANIQHHEAAIERERQELARHQAVLEAYTHAIVLWDESAPAAPADTPKPRRQRRDIVAMVREHRQRRPEVSTASGIAILLGIRTAQAEAALAKINAETPDDAPAP